MSIVSIKKILLAGTALVAVAALSTQAQAVGVTATGNNIWGESHTATNATVITAGTGADLALGAGAFVTTVTNDGVASDTTTAGANTFTLGNVTGGTAGEQLVITSGASPADLTVNIGSFAKTVSVVADTINNTGVPTSAVNVIDAGAWTSGAGGLTITNSAAVNKAVSLSVGGAYAQALASTITAGSVTGADATLTVTGATAAFTNGVTLQDVAGGAASHATIVLNGSVAQTVTGAINNNASDEGVLTITNTNASGVTDAAVIGNTGVGLHAINAGVAGTTTTLTGGVKATTLNVTGTGTVAFGAGAFAGNVAFGANDGVITQSTGGFTGNVDSTSATPVGTLSLTGADTFTGFVGATNAIKAVNVGGGVSSFSQLVKAQTITINGANNVTFTGGATGALNFTADGTATIGAGTNLTGAVTTSVGGTQGTLALAGASTVSGQVGVATTGLLKAVTIAGAGADIFSNTGGVFATTTTLSGASTVTLDGGLTGTTLAYGAGGGTVVLADAKNITAAITTTANTSTLTVNGTSTFANTIGSGAAGAGTSLLLINANGAAGKTATFNGAVTTSTLDVNGAGTVALNAATTGNVSFVGNGIVNLAAGQTITGNVDTPTTAGTGNFSFLGTGDTVTGTFGAAHALNSLTVGAAGTSGLTDTVTSNLVAANTTSVNGNVLHTGGTFNLGATQTLNATITGAGASGQVTSGGISTVATGATVNVSVASAFTTAALPGFTHNYTVVDSTGGTAVGTVVIAGGSSLWSFTQVGTGVQDLVIDATRLSVTSLGTTPNNSAVGSALDKIAAGNGGGATAAAVTAVQNNLNAATSTAQVNNILSSLTPTVNGGAQTSAIDVGAQVQDITDTRMAALRANDGSSGVAAGASANGVSMWVQGYGQSATQDERDSVAGYDATTWGGAVGVDSTTLVNDGVLGFALNYGKSDVDSKDVNSTKTTVDNYGLTLYSTVGLGQQVFVNGQLGYAYNKIDNTRHDVGGVGGPSAVGSTHSDQYTAKVALGRDYAVDYGTILTPDVSANYTYLNTNGYTEAGSGANLTVGSNSQNALDLGVGVKAGWKLKNPDGSLMKPTLHAGYSYAAINDRIDTTANFVGSPAASFTTSGPSPERNKFNLGAGITYMTTANWDVSANYNYQYRSDYQSHTGVVRATTHF